MARVTKLLAAAAAVATVMGMASSANAVITATGSITTFGIDNANFPVVTCEFPTCAAPFAFTTTGAATVQTGNSSLGAAPPGDATAYMTVPGAATATLAAVGNVITGLSFYMGSPDTYNSISFYAGNTLVQTLASTDDIGGYTVADGNQTIGQRVTINGLVGQNITSVVFASSSTAFEFDRVIATATPVPEPATWGMMILGMGMVGMGLRLRRRPAAVLAA